MYMVFVESDIPDLIGKFILEIDATDTVHRGNVSSDNWYFIKEKRLSLVCYNEGNITLQGFYYSHFTGNKEEFIQRLNGKNKKGEDRGRKYRLLTTKELEIVMSNLIKENL